MAALSHMNHRAWPAATVSTTTLLRGEQDRSFAPDGQDNELRDPANNRAMTGKAALDWNANSWLTCK